MNRTATFLTQLGLTLAFASTITACGGSEPTPLPPDEPAPPADTQTATPSEAPTADAPVASAAPTTTTAPIASVAPPTTATPTAAPTAPPPAAGLDVPGANLSIGSITADGFTMRDIACKSDDAGGLGGLVLGPALAGVLSKKKAQLRACSPKGGEARVRFVMEGGKVISAEAKADTPQIEACVAKVVKSAQAPLGGTCAATFDLSR